MPVIPFATQAYVSDSLPVSAQMLTNFYAEKEPQDAKASVVLFGAPGFSVFADVGTGPIRAMNVMNDILYVVSGPDFFAIQPSGSSQFLGTGISGTNTCSMANNGVQVGTVNGKAGYIYDSTLATNQLQPITDPDFHPANTITFFDDYFVFDWAGTNKWFFSALLDGTKYDALDFETASVNSDFVVAIVNQQETLQIFGQNTIELSYDTGANDNPFARYDGGTQERGCAAPLTPIKEDNSVFFLGNDLIFYRLNFGTILLRVSTHAIEYAWGTYLTVSDAFTFSWTFKGHKFIALTFPSVPATWVFDISTGLWHMRESRNGQGVSIGRWRANCAVSFVGKTMFGDGFSGIIGELSETVWTEYGNVIVATAVSPPIHADRKRMFMSSFELDMETGTGLSNGQGSNPQVMLDWSDNGGRTFRGAQMWRSLGKVGEYQKRVRWTRLGQFRNRIMRVSMSDPVARTIIAAHADISSGM